MRWHAPALSVTQGHERLERSTHVGGANAQREHFLLAAAASPVP